MIETKVNELRNPEFPMLMKCKINPKLIALFVSPNSDGIVLSSGDSLRVLGEEVLIKDFKAFNGTVTLTNATS